MTTLRAAGWFFLLLPAVADAQSLAVGAYGVVGTYNEVAATNRGGGFGGAVGVDFRVTRAIAIQGLVSYSSVKPSEDPSLPRYKILHGQLHARYALSPLVAVELGYVRRRIDPEFAAQDVGGFGVGARIEQGLASTARLFVRGAYIPIAQFSGGGSATLSYQIGFGISVAPLSDRWRVTAEYDFVRFGRTVGAADVPIQSEEARVGVEVVVF